MDSPPSARLVVLCLVVIWGTVLSVDVPGYMSYDSRDCDGNLLGSHNDTNEAVLLEASTCATECTKVSGCIAFAHDPLNEKCYFYSSCDPSISSGSLDAYVAVRCGNPPELANGVPTVNLFYYPYAANYVCLADYVLNGIDTVMCDTDGNWTGTPPVCDYTKFEDCKVHCESSDLSGLGHVFTCDSSDYVMDVVYANFGRLPSGPCAPVGITATGDCLNPDSNDEVKSLLNGYSNRTLLLSDITNRGDCAEAYLTVEYKCLYPNRSQPENCYADCFESPVANSTSSLEYSLAGTSVKYVCDPGFQIKDAVTSASVKCRDGGIYEAPPTCSPINCTDISISSGVAVPESSSYTGTEVQFTCNEGFERDGAASILCQPNATWSDPFPTCNAVDCGNLTDGLINAVLSSPSGTTYSQNGTIECIPGYEIVPDVTSQFVTCQSSGTWMGAINCTIVDCSSPPVASENGTYSYTSGTDVTTYGEVFTYSCNAGYLPETTLVACNATGAWNLTEHICTALQCEALSITDAHPATYSDAFNYLSQANVTCHDGFEPLLDSSTTCEKSGQWEPAVSCHRISCGRPGEIAGATVVNASSYVYEDETNYTCNEGHETEHSATWATVTCQANGTWTQAPICSKIDCGSPAPITVGVGTVQTPQDTLFEAMTTYTCAAGYVLVGDDTITCEADKNWSASPPVCEGVECTSLGTIQHGLEVSNGGSKFPSNVTYTCNEGYTMSGDETISCQTNGTWSNSIPTCTGVECHPPGTIQHGMEVSNGGTRFPSNVTYTCNEGYTMSGDETISCQTNGTWSNSIPTCTVVDCSMAPVDGANGDTEVVTGTTFNSTVTYSCLQGYKFVADAVEVNRCTASGSWLQATASDCEVIDCGDLQTELANGVVVMSGTVYGDNVTYSCDYTHTEVVYYCSDSGMWNGTAPTCPGLNCSEIIDTVADGSIVSQSERHVQYACNSGYMLNGEDNLTCTGYTNWSHPLPTCDLVREVRVLVYMTTTLDCDDYDDATLANVLTAARNTLVRGAVALLQAISQVFRISESVVITGIRCNSPLQILFEVTVNNTQDNVTATTQLIVDALSNLLSQSATLDVDGEALSLNFTSLNPSANTDVVCEAGYFTNVDTAQCEACEKNTYQPADIPEICLSCPSGLVTDGEGTAGNRDDVCKEEGDNTELVLGLSIGIPLGLIFILVIIALCCIVFRKHSTHPPVMMNDSDSIGEQYDSRKLGYKYPHYPQQKTYGDYYPYRW